MSRKKRQLRKRFVVFCEGNTEYNYIDKMRRRPDVVLAIEPVNMGGGGYASFLEIVKTKTFYNCLAKFIVVDADRLLADKAEEKRFMELVDYCKRQNDLGTVPHFLIVNQPDFEYIACLHDERYNGKDTHQFILKIWKYKQISEFKADEHIYDFLNKGKCSVSNMLQSLQERTQMIVNEYHINKTLFDIGISKTEVFMNNAHLKGSNINEFFDVIDW